MTASGQIERQIRAFGEIPENLLDQLKGMGMDDSPLLNDCESAYFNMVFFRNSTKDFDFAGKKVGFILGRGKTDKRRYFDLEKFRLAHPPPSEPPSNHTGNHSALHILDKNQKEETGGYDAVIVYWDKMGISKKDIIKKLKTKENNPKSRTNRR
jgi:hypothetical protein